MDLRLYPKYKDSGVEWLGEIPEHWEIKRLKYPAKLINVKVENENNNLKYIGLENLESWTGNLIESENQIEFEGQANLFKSGDVLFCKLRPYLAKAYQAAEDGLCTSELLVLRPKEVIRSYLFYFLMNPNFIEVVNSSTYGAKMPRANWDFIGDLLSTIPNPEEQTQIASFLDHETSRIDKLIEKKNRQIELLQEKRSALITHAVTKGLNPNAKMKDSGVEWIGEIPEGWEIFSIKHLLKNRKDAIKTGPFGSQLLSSEMMAGDIKVYNQRNVLDNDFESGENYISYEKYTELKAFRIFPDDLLITTRGTIGRCAIFPNNASEGILHPCLMRIQVDSKKILHKYLSIIIQESSIVRTNLQLLSNATTIDVIYSDSLKSVKMPIPTISEQIQIAQFLEKETSKIDTLISKIQFSIDKLTEFRTALISAAVTGKIDVRNEACI